MKNSDQEITYKIRATAIVWGFATAMLGISVPLTTIAQSGIILPLAVIFVAGASTVSVWRSRRADSKILTESQNKLSTIETRIIDLETICSNLELEKERKFKQLESK